jgi:hypothetical protein
VENSVLMVARMLRLRDLHVKARCTIPSDSVKYHLPVGYAADLTSVVGAREAGASWNARRMVETVWKLERGVDFSGGKEYGERASGRTPGKMA